MLANSYKDVCDEVLSIVKWEIKTKDMMEIVFNFMLNR